MNFSFGQAAGTSSAPATTSTVGGLGAKTPGFGNFSFGNPAAGATTTGFTLPQSAAASAATLPQKTVRFELPSTTSSASTLTSLLAATTTSTLGSSSASLTGFQLGASTAVCTSGLPVSGSVASAPAIGFSFGSTSRTTTTTTTTGLIGLTSTAGTSLSTCGPTSFGLGGIAGTSGAAGVGKTCDAKAVKENCMPPDILTAVDGFTKYIKNQKSVRESIARMSSKPLFRIQDDINSLRQQLLLITSGLQRNAVAIEKLKKETAQELKHAEIAQRTKETPAGLQYENTAPSAYFLRLAEEFEVNMQIYRQQILEMEHHLASADQSAALSPQDLSVLLNKLNEGFIALAAQLQVSHEAVKEQKETYRQYRQAFHGDTTDVFDRKAMSRTMAQTVPVIPSTLGPTPFSSMSSAAALAMTSALNRTQPVAGTRSGFGLTSAVVGGLGQGSVLTAGTGTLFGQQAAGFGTSSTTSSSLFGSTPALPTAYGAANPLAATTSFTLQKTPIGSKRGKNA